MKTLRQFDYKGFIVTLGEVELPPVIGLGGIVAQSQQDVTILSWTPHSWPNMHSQDITRDVMESADLDKWQKHAELCIDYYLEMPDFTPPLPRS